MLSFLYNAPAAIMKGILVESKFSIWGNKRHVYLERLTKFKIYQVKIEVYAIILDVL